MTAAEKYFEKSMKIQEQISKLQTALESHNEAFSNDKGNWGFVGDLGMVSNELSTLEDFMISAGVRP